MSSVVEQGTALSWEAFWAWLKKHDNCILQASGENAHLYDADDLHWHLAEESDRTRVIQLIQGKRLLAELLIDPGEVLFVQAVADTEDEQNERFVFEIIAGPKDDARPICSFLLAHGYEEQQKHGAVTKH